MTEEAWPSPREPSREPLPRVEDLPIAEQGYEQESVRAAFDSFYRHAAQLDAALRTLEAVDSFHRQAAALRADLRTLRTAGWTQQSWNVTPAYGYARRAPREGVSPVVWRVAGEAAFLIAAAVVVGVAKLDWWLILLVMAGAFLIVLLIELAAGREQFVAQRMEPAPAPPVVEGEAVGEKTEEEDSLGWTAFEEAQEPSDAMTMVGAPPATEPEAVAAEAAAEPEPEPEPEPEAAPEPEPEPDPSPSSSRKPSPGLSLSPRRPPSAGGGDGKPMSPRRPRAYPSTSRRATSACSRRTRARRRRSTGGSAASTSPTTSPRKRPTRMSSRRRTRTAPRPRPQSPGTPSRAAAVFAGARRL